MNKLTEQTIALSGIFSSAALVDDIATNNKFDNAAASCLIKSLTVANPETTLDVFAGDINPLKDGMRNLLQAMLKQNYKPQVVSCSLTIIKLQNLLSTRSDLLNKIAGKLPYIENQCDNFGVLHDNVIEACDDIYKQTVSTLQHRIYIVGKKEYLEQNSSLIRTLLLTGIRCAVLWQQLGGNRWHLLLKRRKILQEINTLLA